MFKKDNSLSSTRLCLCIWNKSKSTVLQSFDKSNIPESKASHKSVLPKELPLAGMQTLLILVSFQLKISNSVDLSIFVNIICSLLPLTCFLNWWLLTGVMKFGFWIWSSGLGLNHPYQAHPLTHVEANHRWEDNNSSWWWWINRFRSVGTW